MISSRPLFAKLGIFRPRSAKCQKKKTKKNKILPKKTKFGPKKTGINAIFMPFSEKNQESM